MSTPEQHAEGQDGVLPGQGAYNPAGYSNPHVDRLTREIRVEIDPAKRQALIDEAFQIHKEDIGHFPLHQQALAWGVRDGLNVVQRADDAFVLRWVTID